MWQVNDSVMIKTKSNRSGPLTREVKIGQITAFADENTAIVQLPERFGRMITKEVPVDQLEAAPHMTKRQVHIGF